MALDITSIALKVTSNSRGADFYSYKSHLALQFGHDQRD